MKWILSILLALMSCQVAVAQKADAEASIRDFFRALSELDDTRLRSSVTPDFLLLENGTVWTIDSLILKLDRMKGKQFSRRNSFSIISNKTLNNVAWISYDNRAEISIDGILYHRKWLESAVLVKEGNAWKIQLLHATKIE